MRRYVLGTGLIGALTTGYSLLKGSREQPFTWRVALAWVSWGIMFALSIGMIVDIRKASRGEQVSDDSPIAGQEDKYRRASSIEKAAK